MDPWDQEAIDKKGLKIITYRKMSSIFIKISRSHLAI